MAVFRKHIGAWASYAGSDFDIDAAMATAIAQSSDLDLNRLAELAGLQPVLAKKHYYETGTLGWFQTDLSFDAAARRRWGFQTRAGSSILNAAPWWWWKARSLQLLSRELSPWSS